MVIKGNDGTVYADSGYWVSEYTYIVQQCDLTCNDGTQNQGETGVDCGGPCAPCETSGDQNPGGDPPAKPAPPPSPPSPSPGPPTCGSDPNKPFGSKANVGTGSYSHEQVLFSTGGTFATTFSLYYNSRNKSVGPLGGGWSHSFSARLFGPTAADANHIYLRSGSGIITVYTLTNGSFLPPPGDTSTLTRNPDNSAILAYPDGLTYNFDTNGNLVLVTDRHNSQTSLTYTNGDLAQITDAIGRGITLTYDTSFTPHRLTWVTDPAGNAYELKYQNGLLWRVVNPLANAQATTQGYWEYTYNGNDLLLIKRDPNGNVSKNVYQSDLRIQTSTDPEGTINPAGHTRSLTYGTPVGSLLTTTLTEKDGTIWTYGYDTQKGLLKSKTDPNGKVSRFTYFANNHLKSITVPYDFGKSLTTFYTYDSFGNMLTETGPADLSVYSPPYNDPETVTDPSALAGLTPPIKPAFRYTYDTAAHFYRLTGESDERGATALVTTYAYTTENGGDVVTATAPGNFVTVTKYNPNGTVRDKIDANGKTTHIEYYPVTADNIAAGSAGQLWWIVGPDGVKLTYTAYDKNGNPTEFKLTDTNNADIPVKTTQGYDALNRLVSVLKESTLVPPRFPANLTRFGYDDAGNRNSLIDAETHETKYEYRYDHQIKKVTSTVNGLALDAVYEYGGTSCPSCSGVDKLTAVKDPNQVKNNLPGTVYQYDAVGRLQYETDPLGKKTRYEYYDNGLLWKKYDATGGDPGTLLVTYQYNNRGLLTDRLFPDGTYVHNTYYPDDKLWTAENQNIAYTYTYYDNGRLKDVTDNVGRKISYDSYDNLGQRTQVTILKGGGVDERVINYNYDTANRPWHITSSAGTFTYAYDALGRRDTLDYPNGTQSVWDYDDLDRLAAITHRATGGAAFATYSYPYRDQVGNITDVTGDRNATYFYDEIYRLLSVVAGNPEAFTYDDAGNRKTGPGPKDTAYLANDANQITTGRKLLYGYDNFGNQTSKAVPGATDKSWTQTWDYENRLIKVEKIKGSERKTVAFKYDPFGRRIEKNLETVVNDLTKTSKWTYVYDNDNIALEIYTPPSGPDEKTFYTHGPGTDEHLALERGGSFYYYHADSLGSIGKITDAGKNIVQSYSYDSFGMVTPANNTFRNCYTYTGREWDKETGLYYYRARYYDPMEGRFISKDPIGFDGGDFVLYGYVRNKPINHKDPKGLELSKDDPKYCSEQYYKDRLKCLCKYLFNIKELIVCLGKAYLKEVDCFAKQLEGQ